MILNKVMQIKQEEFEKLKAEYIDHLTEYFVHYIDGTILQSKQDYLDHFKITYKFPSYFGNNVDAFIDCMSDLDMREEQGFVIVVHNYAKSFMENKEEKERFFEALKDVAHYLEKECLTTSGGRNHLKSFDVYLIDEKLTAEQAQDKRRIDFPSFNLPPL